MLAIPFAGVAPREAPADGPFFVIAATFRSKASAQAEGRRNGGWVLRTDLYRALSDAGATILAVPAAFTVPTGRAHWEVLLRARAIESAAFVIAAAQSGRHLDGRETYGHSLAVDPWGTILLDMGEAPGLALVEIDPGAVDAARARIPVLSHRRSLNAAEVAA